jgi:hypothetical protein
MSSKLLKRTKFAIIFTKFKELWKGTKGAENSTSGCQKERNMKF